MLASTHWELLLGVVVLAAVMFSEGGPPGPPGTNVNTKGAATPGTALIAVPSDVPLMLGGQVNATVTTGTVHAAQNGTAEQPASANVTAQPSLPNATGHEGDAVLHFGGESGGEVVKTPQPHKYFFTDWITWREDNYLMSILIPIACGVAAAVLILCSLACIGCCRRRCRSHTRRKLHRKIDPKTFRKMKAADRIKLLAASSDEEF